MRGFLDINDFKTIYYHQSRLLTTATQTHHQTR